MLAVNRINCMRCGACVGTCPENLITLYESRILFDPELPTCADCKRCVLVCPNASIKYELFKK